jgi:uncharacterized protein (DUF885 family)
MDRREFLASSGVAAIAATGALAVPSGPARSQNASSALLERVSEDLLSEYPEDATFLGLDVGSRMDLHAKLTDRSIEGDASRGAACAARLMRMKAFDGSALSGIESVNLQVAIEAHELADEGYRNFQYGDNAVLNIWQAESNSPYVVSQATGFFATIPDFLDSQHKIESAADAEAYLSRLTALGAGIDDENARLERDASNGSVAPDFLIDTTLRQQVSFRAAPVAQWGLVTSLARRAKLASLSGDWSARAQTLCEQRIVPALDRQIGKLQELRARATHDAGCWKLRDGDAYYDWLLKVGTTTRLSPDEVHRLGLDQVRSIGAEMDQLLRKQGMSQGTVGQRMTALGKDKRFLFANDDAGRAELLTYLNGIIADIRGRLPQAFASSQKADLVIKRVPPAIEAGAPNGYEQDGPIDGSRPASYYINLRDTSNFPKFSLPTLCFHEGLPGHVWQGSFVHHLPTIRSQLMFNAYVEGWALYAEQLADELGMYADDPFGRLGYLQSIQFRACRLVVDTGMHAKRWSREQAVNWMVENNGNTVDAATSEIDRYCAWPGQACGYQVGHLHIDGLRKKAEAALGRRFDLRLFNDALLTSGNVPLTLLDTVIDEHIRQRSA